MTLFFAAGVTLALPTGFALESLVPVATLALLMVVALVMELSSTEEESVSGFPPICGLATTALLGLLAFLFSRPYHAYQETFSGMMVDDGLCRGVTAVVAIALVLVFMAGPSELERHRIKFKGEYYALLLAAGLGMVIMAGANNLMMIFLGLELFSLALYLLCIFFPTERPSQESGLKYFILSSAASAFILYGMALVYGVYGSTYLNQLQGRDGGLMFTVAVVMILCGLTFKISAVPFHIWTPDVYEGAPTSVTAFMSVATKTAALAVMVRLFVLVPSAASLLDPMSSPPDVRLVLEFCFAFSLLSIILGNLMALGQTSVKRMLAYSGVAHAGYLLMAVVTGKSAIQALLFYVLCYTFMNVGAFLAVLALEWHLGETVTYDSLRGTSHRAPFLAWTFAICLVSLAGLPPAAGFLAKFYLFGRALDAGLVLLPVAGIVGSFVGAAYYMKAVFYLFAPEPERGLESEPWEELPTWLAVSLAVAAAGSILTGLAPGFFFHWLALGA